MLKSNVKKLPTHLLKVIHQLLDKLFPQGVFEAECIDSSIQSMLGRPLVRYDLVVRYAVSGNAVLSMSISNTPFPGVSKLGMTTHKGWYFIDDCNFTTPESITLLNTIKDSLIEHITDLIDKQSNPNRGQGYKPRGPVSTSDSRRRHVQTPPHHTLPSLQDTINLVVEEYEQSLQQAREEIERLSEALEQYQRYYEENERSRNHFGFSGQNDYRYSTESTNRDAELAETLRRVEEKLDKVLEPKPKRESIFTNIHNQGQMPKKPVSEMPPLKKPTKGGYTPTVEDPTATPIPPKAKRKYTRKNKEIVADPTVIKATIRDTKPEYVSDIPLPEKPKK